MTMRTLYCEAGDHKWERPAQRGRAPRNCPEHTVVVEPKPKAPKPKPKISGLEKARRARAKKKAEEANEWNRRIEEVINDPRMKVASIDPYSTDARRDTISKLRYIQDQLTNRKDRPQNELSDLEKIREKIMRDPFNRTGHLY